MVDRTRLQVGQLYPVVASEIGVDRLLPIADVEAIVDPALGRLVGAPFDHGGILVYGHNGGTGQNYRCCRVGIESCTEGEFSAVGRAIARRVGRGDAVAISSARLQAGQRHHMFFGRVGVAGVAFEVGFVDRAEFDKTIAFFIGEPHHRDLAIGAVADKGAFADNRCFGVDGGGGPEGEIARGCRAVAFQVYHVDAPVVTRARCQLGERDLVQARKFGNFYHLAVVVGRAVLNAAARLFVHQPADSNAIVEALFLVGFVHKTRRVVVFLAFGDKGLVKARDAVVTGVNRGHLIVVKAARCQIGDQQFVVLGQVVLFDKATIVLAQAVVEATIAGFVGVPLDEHLGGRAPRHSRPLPDDRRRLVYTRGAKTTALKRRVIAPLVGRAHPVIIFGAGLQILQPHPVFAHQVREAQALFPLAEIFVERPLHQAIAQFVGVPFDEGLARRRRGPGTFDDARRPVIGPCSSNEITAFPARVIAALVGGAHPINVESEGGEIFETHFVVVGQFVNSYPTAFQRQKGNGLIDFVEVFQFTARQEDVDPVALKFQFERQTRSYFLGAAPNRAEL